jgi:hypothetical protein
MTYHSIAKITFGALLVTLAGCKDSGLPVEPSAPPPSEPSAPTNFPVPSSAASVYDRISPSLYADGSRYVIYDNGTFSLQYAFGQYLGRYSRTDSAITFQFDGWSAMGPWLAGGTFTGDSLTVKYNDVMNWSDFEDGTYMRSTTESSIVTGG